MLQSKFSVFLLLLCAYAKPCKGNTTLGNTILEDLQRAFRLVTNNTNTVNIIIPKMYNQTTADPMLVFRMPNEGKNSATMIWMPRSNFMRPVFPNLTEEKQSSSWNAFGLDGWSGEISEPCKSNHKTFDYPTKEILKDFAAEELKDTQLHNDEAEELELSSNVYIARVNNPFGYSTKWQLRNRSSIDTLGANKTSSTIQERLKRDVVELYSMIKCSTGCDPLTYKGYGCYCGFAGDGVPVDGIDRCCRVHDKCYERTNCISYLEYFVPYVWKCYFGKPLCALDHGEWGGPLSCAARLCYCDTQLSRCLQEFVCPWRRPVCLSRFARLFKFF